MNDPLFIKLKVLDQKRVEAVKYMREYYGMPKVDVRKMWANDAYQEKLEWKKIRDYYHNLN